MLNLLDISVDRNVKKVITYRKLPDAHTEIYDGCAYLFIRDIAEPVGKIWHMLTAHQLYIRLMLRSYKRKDIMNE